jgi:hypothetical protein
MAAWVLARHAMVPLNYGTPEVALRIATRARRAARATPTAGARAHAERLNALEEAESWFGYPAQKHFVHLSQAYTLIGDAEAACSAKDDALGLTASPSVMTRPPSP